MKKIFEALKLAGKDFMEDKCLSQAAALSFYAVTALPPLVVIILSVTGLIVDSQMALNQLTQEIATLFGDSTAQLVREIGQNRTDSENKAATVIGFITLLMAASGFFGQLQDALNDAWEVRVKPSAGWKVMLQKRLLSMSAVLGTAFLLLVSLLLSAVTTALGSKLESLTGLSAGLIGFIQIPITLLVIGTLFSSIYKVLPDAKVDWKHAALGGLFATSLFVVGKFAFGVYLGKSNPGDAYGSAGSLVLLLFWIYFSTNVLLLGAEIAQSLAKVDGMVVRPESHAEQFEEVVVKNED